MKIIINIVDKFFNEELANNELKLIKGVYIINSIARGEYIRNISDIDVLVIFKKGITLKQGGIISKRIHKKLTPLLNKYKTAHYGEVLDLPWEIDGRYNISKLNCFSFYSQDLKEYNIHIFGEDVLKKIKLKAPSRSKRIKKIIDTIKSLNKTKKIKEQNLLIGSIVRHFLFIKGIKILKKSEIFKYLRNSEYKNILEFFNNCKKNSLNNKNQLKLNKSIIDLIIQSLNL